MMTTQIARQQLEKRFDSMRKTRAELTVPQRGWVRAIRQALGMSAGQFAKRLKVAQPRVTAIEKSELSGGITIRSMRAAAEALDCHFVYVLIPKRPLDELVEERARLHAKAHVKAVDHTMSLENQALAIPALEEQEHRVAHELMEEQVPYLWSDPKE